VMLSPRVGMCRGCRKAVKKHVEQLIEEK